MYANKVILIGRATTDITVTTVGDNQHRASFVVAIDRSFKNEEGKRDTDFIRVTAWNKTAVNAQKIIKKGMSLYIEAHVQTGRKFDKCFPGARGRSLASH